MLEELITKTLVRDIKQSTFKVYNDNIMKMYSIINADAPLDEIGLRALIINFQDIKTYFDSNDYTDNTKKNYINSLIVITKMSLFSDSEKNSPQYIKILDNIFTYFKLLKNRITQTRLKNDNEDISFLTPKIYDDLLARMRIEIDRRLENKQSKNINDCIQMFVLFLLYRGKWISPLRNDYAAMRISSSTSGNLSPHLNYVVNSKNEKDPDFPGEKNYILINDDKVSKIAGSKFYSIGINTVLNKYLNILLKIRIQENKDYLLENPKNKNIMTKNNLTKYLQSAFKTWLNKKISTSILRKIFISNCDFNKTTQPPLPIFSTAAPWFINNINFNKTKKNLKNIYKNINKNYKNAV